jgi:hypothetical protein
VPLRDVATSADEDWIEHVERFGIGPGLQPGRQRLISDPDAHVEEVAVSQWPMLDYGAGG